MSNLLPRGLSSNKSLYFTWGAIYEILKRMIFNFIKELLNLIYLRNKDLIENIGSYTKSVWIAK